MTRRVHGDGKLKHSFGWHPPIPRISKLPKFGDSGEIVVTVIPDTIDLRSLCPPVRDQSSQGCCTGFASASAITFQMMKQGLLTNPPDPNLVASPEFIYTVTRMDEGTFPNDDGASVADTVTTLVQTGAAPEKDMPYDPNVFNQNPSPTAYADALKNQTLHPGVIYGNDVALIDNALSNNYTVLIGISVYSSFESQNAMTTGVIPDPDVNIEELLGGHCIEIVGKQVQNGITVYTFKNSWGTSWGDKGYGYITENYLKNPNLSSDWHVIELMS
jgi:C1A family cysteine protease